MIRCYARVSSKGQEKYGNGLESQIAELKAAGGEMVYSDAYTGTECSRPNFDRLLEELEPNDTLMCTKLDRIARSFSQGSKGIRYLPSINAASPKSKRRWAVNHIRHNLTDYDIKVSDLENLEGNPQLNYAYFKDLILTRIKKVYPQYSDECDKQIKNLWEIYHRKFSA